MVEEEIDWEAAYKTWTERGRVRIATTESLEGATPSLEPANWQEVWRMSKPGAGSLRAPYVDRGIGDVGVPYLDLDRLAPRGGRRMLTAGNGGSSLTQGDGSERH
jgi:hypothetical protein